MLIKFKLYTFRNRRNIHESHKVSFDRMQYEEEEGERRNLWFFHESHIQVKVTGPVQEHQQLKHQIIHSPIFLDDSESFQQRFVLSSK